MKFLEAFGFFCLMALSIVAGVGAVVAGAYLATAGYVLLGIACGVFGFAASAAFMTIVTESLA